MKAEGHSPPFLLHLHISTIVNTLDINSWQHTDGSVVATDERKF
jgi:hypothetical protein